jgi:hypothetical protein
MRYLMSERTAQFVRGLMQDAQTPESVAAGPAKRTRSDAVVEDSFAHPFELRWAASAGDASGGSPKGAWIIWLPKGSLVVDGVEASTDDLTAANGYPDGWYDLTDIFGEAEAPEEFDLFLDVGAKVKFAVERDSATNPVLIAQVKGKAVKGVVESAIVTAFGAPVPWELRRFYDEPEEGSGGDPVAVWRVWIPAAALTFVVGSIERKVIYDDGASNPITTEADSSSAVWGSADYAGDTDGERTAAAGEAGLSGVWANVDIPDGGGSVYLRIVSGDGLLHHSTVSLVTELPSSGDGSVDHPLSLKEQGFHIKIASATADGVVTQCVRSMLALTVMSGAVVNKVFVGENGIAVSDDGYVVRIRATGGSGGGGDGAGDGAGDDGDGVLSIKGLTGHVGVAGGKGIKVTAKKNTIVIEYEEGKEPDEEAEDETEEGSACDHPGSDPGGFGGVGPPVYYGGGGDWGVGGGGVSAGGDVHEGSDGCNC